MMTYIAVATAIAFVLMAISLVIRAAHFRGIAEGRVSIPVPDFPEPRYNPRSAAAVRSGWAIVMIGAVIGIIPMGWSAMVGTVVAVLALIVVPRVAGMILWACTSHDGYSWFARKSLETGTFLGIIAVSVLF